MIRRWAVSGVVTAAVVLAGAAPSGAAETPVRLVAYVNGAAERPGPGDPDGAGRAVVDVYDDANKLCISVQVANIALPLTGMHIHFAPPTAAGPVVVAFAVPASTVNSQCVSVENEALLDNIAANPQQYYVNIHNQAFPAGAVRGQLQFV